MAHVLVVEDERVVARDIQRSLTDLGHDVPATAASAEQALLLASERRPDLVLMDVRIKGERDGIETAGILRERFQVPIIYMTAYSDPATVERAKETEPYGYLLKPVKTHELRSMVEIALYKHRMEQEALEREQWLATVLRSIGDAVVAADRSGLVKSMNPAAEALTGWAEAHAVGRPSGEVVRVVDGEPGVLVDPLGRCLREGRTVHLSGPLLPQNSRPALVQSIATPLRDRHGHLVGGVAVLRDVSEETRLQRRVDVIDRLAWIGTMSSGLVHQLRGPLALIEASLQDARNALAGQVHEDTDARRGGPLADVARALTSAEWGSQRAHRLVSDLSGLALHDQAGGQEAVDVHEALEGALEEVRQRAPGVRVVVERGEVPEVDAAPVQLGHVFAQLMISAARPAPDAGTASGTVEVTTRADDRGRALVEFRGVGACATCAPEAHAPDGSGQASPGAAWRDHELSACCAAVRSLGGTIEIDSRPDTAMTIRMRLPPRGTASAGVPSGPDGDGHILIVEHELATRSIMSRAITNGHLVTWTKRASDGLALLQGGMSFDVILCDLDLPDLAGVELHRELQRSWPDQASRVIFLAGRTSDPRVVDLLASVTNWRLEKPLDPGQLRDVIRAVLEQLGRDGEEGA